MAGTRSKKRLSKPRKAIIIICSVILALAIVCLAIYFIQLRVAANLYTDTVRLYAISAGESEQSSGEGAQEYEIDWDGLLAVNPDVVAWIRVPAIPGINYPVIHYTDNDYYLRRSWQGDYLVSGCIFEDWNCSPDFSDPHTIVYGHNMNDGTMFGELKKFRDQSFYDENDDSVIIYTPDRTLFYTIFSVQVVAPGDSSVYLVNFERGSDFSDFVEGLKNSSEYDTGINVSGSDTILTLSTCSGDSATKRLVVHAKLIQD